MPQLCFDTTTYQEAVIAQQKVRKSGAWPARRRTTAIISELGMGSIRQKQREGSIKKLQALRLRDSECLRIISLLSNEVCDQQVLTEEIFVAAKGLARKHDRLIDVMSEALDRMDIQSPFKSALDNIESP